MAPDPACGNPAPSDLFDEIHRLHRELAERAGDGSWDSVDAVLYLGTAVLLHGVLERAVRHRGRELLDAAALGELEAEHGRLTEDLRTLGELSRTAPASPDVEQLAEAVFRHLGELLDVGQLAEAVFRHLGSHLQRDARILYGPLARLDRLGRRAARAEGAAAMTAVIGGAPARP